MDHEQYQTFPLVPGENKFKNWIEQNYKFLSGGVILILLVCLGLSVFTKSGGQDNGVVVQAGTPSSDALNGGATQSPSVSGTTYGFTIKVGCACGGGEEGQPDIFFKIFKCEDNEEYPEWLSTRVIKDSYYGTWRNAFKLRYDPGLPQLIFLRLLDSDTMSDDKMMDTYCFDPFVTVNPGTKKAYSLEKCTPLDSHDCENGFSLSVIKQ